MVGGISVHGCRLPGTAYIVQSSLRSVRPSCVFQRSSLLNRPSFCIILKGGGINKIHRAVRVWKAVDSDDGQLESVIDVELEREEDTTDPVVAIPDEAVGDDGEGLLDDSDVLTVEVVETQEDASTNWGEVIDLDQLMDEPDLQEDNDHHSDVVVSTVSEEELGKSDGGGQGKRDLDEAFDELTLEEVLNETEGEEEKSLDDYLDALADEELVNIDPEGEESDNGIWEEEEDTKAGDDMSQQKKAEVDRKGAMLVELINAGAQLEMKIADFRSEIDELMLHMLGERLQLAEDMKEDPAFISHLSDLLKRLTNVHKRQTATPAMRLLDDVLAILGDDVTVEDYSQRREEAASRIKEAFFGGAGAGLDIFAAAAALSAGKSLAAEAMAVEYVSMQEFMHEATELLSQAKQQQAELQSALRDFDDEVAAARENHPEILDLPTNKEKMEEMEELRRGGLDREIALLQLEDIIYISRTLQLDTAPWRSS